MEHLLEVIRGTVQKHNTREQLIIDTLTVLPDIYGASIAAGESNRWLQTSRRTVLAVPSQPNKYGNYAGRSIFTILGTHTVTRHISNISFFILRH